MKNLKNFCVAVVLTLVLALPVFAGDISTTVAPPSTPPPAITQGNTSSTVAGEISTGESRVAANSSLTEITMNLLQNVLLLF